MATGHNDAPEAKNGASSGESKKKGVGSYLRKGPARRWVLGVILVALALGVYVIWHYYSIRESTDDALIDGHISPVAARVGGTVMSVEVHDNQYVEAGTVLVQLDPRDYQVTLDQARANLAAAQATARAMQTGVPVQSVTTASRLSTAEAVLRQAEDGVSAAVKEVDTAQARLQSAQARVRETQANYTKAVQDLDRFKKLVAKDEISQQQYDAAVATADASRAIHESAQAMAEEAAREIEASQARLKQARGLVSQAQAQVSAAHTAPEQVTISREQASSAGARVQQAQAAVEEAQLHLDYALVRAPVAGWVTDKTVQVGQVVQPGQGLLALVPLEDVWVTAHYKETQLKNIRPGQEVEISVDAYGRTYKGHVDSIAAATGESFSLLPSQNASGNFVKVVQRVPVKITIDKGQDPEHRLRIGMSVVPTILTR